MNNNILKRSSVNSHFFSFSSLLYNNMNANWCWLTKLARFFSPQVIFINNRLTKFAIIFMINCKISNFFHWAIDKMRDLFQRPISKIHIFSSDTLTKIQLFFSSLWLIQEICSYFLQFAIKWQSFTYFFFFFFSWQIKEIYICLFNYFIFWLIIDEICE